MEMNRYLNESAQLKSGAWKAISVLNPLALVNIKENRIKLDVIVCLLLLQNKAKLMHQRIR